MKEKPQAKQPVKTQIHDGVLTSIFEWQPYRPRIWNALKKAGFPAVSLTDGERLFLKKLERELTNGTLNDSGYLLDNFFLLLAEEQSTVNHLMDFRMLEYLLNSTRDWLNENHMSTSHPLAGQKLLRFRLVIIYTGYRKVTIDDFTKGMREDGIDMRNAIWLVTEDDATDVIWEYIQFCRTWDRNKILYPGRRDLAIEATLDECEEKGYLWEWIQAVGRKEVRTIMTRAATQDRDLYYGWEQMFTKIFTEKYDKMYEKKLEAAQFKGKEEGREEGRRKSQREMVNRILEKMTPQEAADLLDLPLSEILTLSQL